MLVLKMENKTWNHYSRASMFMVKAFPKNQRFSDPYFPDSFILNNHLIQRNNPIKGGLIKHQISGSFDCGIAIVEVMLYFFRFLYFPFISQPNMIWFSY